MFTFFVPIITAMTFIWSSTGIEEQSAVNATGIEEQSAVNATGIEEQSAVNATGIEEQSAGGKGFPIVCNVNPLPSLKIHLLELNS
jgi:hypothetical protein